MSPVITTTKPKTRKRGQVLSQQDLTPFPSIATPYYLIDEKILLENLKKIAYVREKSGAKAVLALKCFSTWAVFDTMRPYLDGTTSSSLFEARLGHEKFGKEESWYYMI